ncbi:PAS domain S-box-containing protein [Flagellimonas taeanensis]|uniref:histidine kinase n=1 Tax=Flagellimonas taeanensis TaxID=1005926 RepID=A0A1M6WAE9_9FLAO|nr:ATP-binding protein [Allomuricauda taeanensis]SFC45130.1 PAS domain S-box-containing protein [Allomuricauda taeanensis]SHK90486.1 PAS domain S-box-containing protein [Allomuricauda taeanensis]
MDQQNSKKEKGASLLFERDRKLRTLVENLPGIVFRRKNDSDWTMQYISDGCRWITGYWPEKLCRSGGITWASLIHPMDREDVWNTVQTAVSKKEKFQLKYRITDKDGNVHWISETGISVDKKGSAVYLEGYMQDITVQIMGGNINVIKERALEEVGNGIVISNAQLKQFPIIYVNKAFEKNTGYTSEEVIKRVSGSKIHPAIAKAMDQVLETSDPCPCTRAMQTKKKEGAANILDDPSWSKHGVPMIEAGIKSIRSTPVMDADDNVQGVLSIFCPDGFLHSPQKEDIVDEMVGLVGLAIEQDKIRKRLQMNQERLEARSKGLEEEVEQRNKDLQQILKELRLANFELNVQITDAQNARKRAEIQEAMLLAIAQKFPKGAIILVNEQMQINFVEGAELKFLQHQIRSNQELSINNLDGFSTKSKSLLLTCIKQTLKGKHLSFEIEYQKKNYIVNTTPLFIENGRTSLALLVLFNISERKRNEGRMLQNLVKERELSELKTQFIGTASHEFRAPLSVILSSASLIEKLNAPDKGEKRLAHLEKIKSNVRHLVNILNDFLSVTKLDEGETKASPEYFDLLHFSSSLIEKVKMGKKKGQSIILECEKAELETFLDPKLMHLVLSNLLNNAIKYSNEDQPIILKIEDKDHRLHLWVTDRGIGIPEDDQKHLFQRFFRAKNSVNIAGTGLGLHIVKTYVELMDGKIDFESKENHGSTFKLEFPKKTLYK